MVQAGAEAFRINASHVDGPGLEALLAAARAAAPNVPVIVDLQGAKMRLGRFEPRELHAGEILDVLLGETAPGLGVPLPHPEAFEALRPGDRLSIDEGRLRASVLAARPGALRLRMHDSGPLHPRKGFNRSVHPIRLTDLSMEAQAQITTATAYGCAEFALSFVFDGSECDWIRRRGDDLRVTAKLETPDALARVTAIAHKADALWLCRGDLGAQVGEVRLGRAVAAIDPRAVASPMYMAGQVLEHLTAHRHPTRSELCHMTELAVRGYAGIILSDETAIGADPLNAVDWAARLIEAEFSPRRD